MLDGRVLGASQVEYKQFGKPPLKREVLRLRSRVQQVLEDFSAVSQTMRICKFSGERQRNTPVADLRTTLLEKPPAAPPARHRSPAEPAPRSGFFPGKKIRNCRLIRQFRQTLKPPRPRHLPGIGALSVGGGLQHAFFCRPQLPGIEARPRHLPGIKATLPRRMCS